MAEGEVQGDSTRVDSRACDHTDSCEEHADSVRTDDSHGRRGVDAPERDQTDGTGHRG